MRLVLDGKSVAVGMFAGAALVAGIGAMQPDGRSGSRDTPPGSPHPGIGARGIPGLGVTGDGVTAEVSQVGRFQIAAAGETVDHITGYVVDTATGQVWRETRAGGKEAFYAPKLDAAK